jgi:hypothetical protein
MYFQIRFIPEPDRRGRSKKKLYQMVLHLDSVISYSELGQSVSTPYSTSIQYLIRCPQRLADIQRAAARTRAAAPGPTARVLPPPRRPAFVEADLFEFDNIMMPDNVTLQDEGILPAELLQTEVEEPEIDDMIV